MLILDGLLLQRGGVREIVEIVIGGEQRQGLGRQCHGLDARAQARERRKAAVAWRGNLRGVLRHQPDRADGGIRHGHIIRTERSEEHTSELQSLMRISYAVSCLKKKNKTAI